MDDLGTTPAAVPTDPTDLTGGPGTQKPAPSLSDLEKLYGAPKAAARAPVVASQGPSLSDLEKQYATPGGSGNIDLGADGPPKKNNPSVSPQGTDQGTGFVDQVKTFGRNLTTQDGRSKIAAGLYHGIVDPLVTVGQQAFDDPRTLAIEQQHDAQMPAGTPVTARSRKGILAAAVLTAATAAPVGELAAAAGTKALETVAPSAAARIADLLGSAGAKGTAARVASASGQSAVHGAAIGAAGDPDHPLTGAAIGAAGGAAIAPVAMGASRLVGDIADAHVQAENADAVRARDVADNVRRTGTNYYPEERAGRLIPAESGKTPPPLPPKVKVTPDAPPAAPEGPDFEVEQNPAPPTPAPASPETKVSGPETIPPVKLLPPGRPGTPTEAPAGVQLPPDDALSYMDDRIKRLLTQRDEATRSANMDGLTGLANQAAWKSALPNAEAHPRMSIVRFDVNGMKGVNDAVGHDAGDQMIQGAAQALQKAQGSLPDGAKARLFRVGGDEFGAIVPTDHAEAFRDATEQAYGVQQHAPGVQSSISGGIGKTNAEADAASYQRKAVQKAAHGIGGRAPAPTPETPALPPSASPEAAKPSEAVTTQPPAGKLPATPKTVNWDPAAWRARYAGQIGQLSDSDLQDALSKLEANRTAAGPGTQGDELIHRDILNVKNELAARSRQSGAVPGSPESAFEQSLLKMDRPALEAQVKRHQDLLDAGLSSDDARTARRIISMGKERLGALGAGGAPSLDDLEKQFAPAPKAGPEGGIGHLEPAHAEMLAEHARLTRAARPEGMASDIVARDNARKAVHAHEEKMRAAGVPIPQESAGFGMREKERPTEQPATQELEPRADLEREHEKLLAELRRPKLSRMDRRTAIQQIDYVRKQLRAHGAELTPLAHERPAKPKGPPALPADIAKKPKLSEDQLEQDARYPDGDRFRPYHTVSTNGLVEEMAALQDRIAARQGQTELRTADERGSAIQVTTRSRNGGPSLQSQARKNITDWTNRLNQITEHLKQARGFSQEEIDELNFQAHVDRADRANRPPDDLDSIPFEVGPVFHGTHGIFPAGELKASRGDLGIHFGTKEQAAERLAYHSRNGIKGWSSGPRTIQAMLGINNPLRAHDAGNWKDVASVRDAIATALDMHPEDLREYTTMPQLRKFLEGQGYDGVVYSNEHEVPGIQDALEERNRAHLAWSVARESGRPDAETWRAKYVEARERVTSLVKEKATDSYIALRPRQVQGAVGESGAHYRAQLEQRASRLEPADAEHMQATFGSPEKGLAAADKVIAMAGRDQATVTFATPAPGELPSAELRKANVQKALRRQDALFASFEPLGKHVPDSLALAKLFRIGRDPTVEHFQLAILNDQDRIVHYERWTSGAVDYVNLDINAMAVRLHWLATEMGGRSVVMGHNHPSGMVRPSGPDIRFTQDLGRLLARVHEIEHGMMFPLSVREHVVIDHDTYSLISGAPRSSLEELVAGDSGAPGQPSVTTHSLPAEAVSQSDWTAPQDARELSSTYDIYARMAAHVRDSSGFDVLHLDTQNRVIADQFYPPSMGSHPDLLDRISSDSRAMGAKSQAIVVHARSGSVEDSVLWRKLSERAEMANRAGKTAIHDVLTMHQGGYKSAADIGAVTPVARSPHTTMAGQTAEPRPQLGMFGEEPAPAPSKKDQLGMFGENEGTKLAQDEAVKLKNKDEKIAAAEGTQRSSELLGDQAAAKPIQTGADQGALFEVGPGFVASFNRAFNPTAASDQAAEAGRIIRAHTGEQARQHAQIEEMMKPIVAMFGRMPEHERFDFYNRMEEGKAQAHPELNKIAAVFRKALDDAAKGVQDLGTGKLRGLIEDYMPHLWENSKKAAVFFGKRPLEGSKSFLKQRKIPTLKEGMAAGLKPVSSNPAELVMLKLFEMHKYIMATRILQEMQARGLAKWVSTRRQAPEGWTLINDPSAVKYGPPTVRVAHKEGFDADLRDQLAKSIEALRIRHSRGVTDPSGMRTAWGWAEKGPARRMWTKLGGGPDVIIHELGHMIDYDHELWNKLVSTPAKRTTKGGKQVSADSPETIAERKKMVAQLRALADARYQGNPGPSYKAYVRNRREQMANAVHALVFAPELGERLAPDIMHNLRAHFAADPALAPLLKLERGVRLGTDSETKEYDTGGVVIMAKMYAPDAVARVLNNYLSPGLRGSPFYNAYMGLGNALNAAQLSLSAFHLGFTSLDASISKFALGLEQIATGQPLRALQSFAMVPAAPITNVMKGNKVLRAYVKPGSQGAQLARIADQVAMAGGRGKMEDWYRVKQWQKMKDAMVEAVKGQGFGHRTGAAGEAVLRALPSVMEVLAKPILEYIVPRQKLGVFADLAQHEMRVLAKRGQPITDDMIRAVMQRAWDSVDNRMGQMVYDNLFWNKTGKDLAHAGMRSVGWNVGTIEELGGAVGDTQKLLASVIPNRDSQGKRIPEPDRQPGERAFTHKMAYALALPMVVGAIGAIITYMSTGDRPKELNDYFYPRTGGKTPEGDDARIELPSYMKDILGFARHPIDTIEHKAMPLLSLIASMLENQDYYGNEIVDHSQAIGRQVEQALAGIGKQFLPFSLQGALEQKARGAGAKVQAAPLIGITPAPKEVTRSPAQQQVYEDAQRRRKGIMTPDEAALSQKKYKLEEREREGENIQADLAEMVRTGEISPADAKRITKAGKTSGEIRRFQALPLDQATSAFQVATPEEKRVLGPILAKKRATARQRHSLKVGQ